MRMKYLKLKFLMVLLALAAAIPPAGATESLTVANGTATNGVAPFFGNKFESTGRIQMIYPSSMLEDMAGADITSITFYQKSTSYNISGGVVEMYIGESENSSFQYTTVYGMFAQNDLTKVATVNGIQTVMNSDFEYTITFNSPYHYEGGNLVIETSVTTRGTSNKTEFYGLSSNGVNVIATSYSITGTGNSTTMYPKATFTYEPGELPDYMAKVTPNAIDFGKIAPNTSLTQDVTVTNKGNNPITPVVIGLTSPFSTSYTPSAIATGESVTIPIVFAPTATGSFDCSIQIGDASSNIDPVDVSLAGSAVYEKTVSDGSVTNSYVPLYGYYYDYKQINQMIYPETMLNDLKGKTIKSMTFYGTNLGLQGGAYTFKVGITENASFSQKARITEGLTTVATIDDGTQSGTELNIVYDEPFVYNGGNLVIDFELTTAGNNYPSNSFYGTSVSAASFNSYSKGSVNADGVYDSGSIQDFLPKVTFAYENGGDTPPVEDPVLVVDPDELDLDEANTFTVLGENLKGDVTITVDNENFTVTPATITKAAAEAEDGATVTVAYVGDNTEGELATITVASLGAESATVTVMGAALEQVATPTFSVEAGEYTEAQSVEIACATAEAIIHYTVDGTDPTAESPVYTEAIAVGQTMTIKAIAMKEGMANSAIASATYTINISQPSESTTFVKVTAADQLVAGKKYIIVCGDKAMGTAPTGNFLTAIDITGGDEVTVNDEGVAIMTLGGILGHYTLALGDTYLHAANSTSLDFGSSTEWAISDYNGTLDGYRVKHADYNRAVRYQSGNNRFGNYSTSDANSDYGWIYVEKGEVTPVVTVADPVFDPEDGTTFEENLTVTLTCATEDATIQYSMNGEYFIDYEAPIEIDETTTIYAKAVLGDVESNVVQATYTKEEPVTPPTPSDKRYIKVYSTEDLKSGTYLIVYEDGNLAFDGSLESLDATDNNIPVTISETRGDLYIQGNDVIDAATFDYDADAKTLKSASGYYIGATTDANTLNTSATEPYTNTVTISEGYDADILSSGGAHLRYNSASNQNRFRYYKSGSYTGQKAIQLYKLFVETPEQVATPTFDPEEGTYTEAQNVTIACETEEATIHYTVDGTEPTAESPVYTEAIAVGETTTIKAIAVKEGMTDSEIASATYTINIPVPIDVAAPTFTPEAGSYTEAQTVTFACETEGAETYYSTDGGNTWTQGNSVNVDEDMTLMIKAMVGNNQSDIVNAVYSFEFPVEPINIEALDGYYFVKNSGKYANVLGRKTLRFTNEPADKAGTVLRIKTDEHGQVQVLRSQGVDLQRYADRAMSYVPELVHLVADKLEMEGVGQLFGETGVDAILAKFNESFDAHLYVEPADGGYRIYGKTPSMQPVVEFYRENQAKCDAKLPQLEAAINRAIEKILEKTNGSGASILEAFSLHTIWEKMNNPYLTEPTDDASIMEFYHQVLMNKDYVWSFAYETAMIYWTNLKNHPRYENEIKPQLGEFAEYLDKIEYVRPNFKYYIVANQDITKPDFISQGNTDIINNAGRTIWSVEPRTDFTVNIPEDNKIKGQYVATLYTDFAYTVPEGVTAYYVKGITSSGYTIPVKVNDGTSVPAQTPVLLFATEPGDVVLTLNDNDGNRITDNGLKGPDYLIKTYEIKAPQVVQMFDMVKTLFGEEIYNRYFAKYEYLQMRYSGMVNNKYFWGLSEDEVAMCGTTNEYDQVECVVRSLDVEDGLLAFYNNGIVSTNKAFLTTTHHDVVKLLFGGDVNRDGKVDIADVTALIDILLWVPESMHFDPEYDYDAADIDDNGVLTIKDVTNLVDYLLGM